MILESELFMNLNNTSDKVGSRFLTVLLFLTCLILILFSAAGSSFGAYFVLYIVILFLSWVTAKKFIIHLTILQKIWYSFMIYTLIVSIYVPLATGDVSRSSVKIILFFLFSFTVTSYVVQFCNRLYFLKLLRNFMAICSVLGVFEYITGFQIYKWLITGAYANRNFLLFGNVSTSEYRLMLFFTHPIYLSIFLNIFLVLLLYVPFKFKIVNISLYIAGLVCLILTQSRSGWLAYIIILLVCFFKSKKFRRINLNTLKYIAIGTVLISILLYTVKLIAPDFFSNLINMFWERINIVLYDPETASGARIGNLSLVNYVNNSLLKIFGGGNGYGMSLLAAHPSTEGWRNAIDNQYLTFLLDYGYVGIGIIILFLIKCLIILIKSRNPIEIVLVLSIFIIFITGYFFEFYISIFINYFLFMLIALVNENGNIWLRKD